MCIYLFIGIILGVTVSAICIACCLSCIVFRRRCLKRAALRRRALQVASSANYYPSDDGAQMPKPSLHLRDSESCAAEAHEMQHLVRKKVAATKMQVSALHLDTKVIICCGF